MEAERKFVHAGRLILRDVSESCISKSICRQLISCECSKQGEPSSSHQREQKLKHQTKAINFTDSFTFHELTIRLNRAAAILCQLYPLKLKTNAVGESQVLEADRMYLNTVLLDSSSKLVQRVRQPC